MLRHDCVDSIEALFDNFRKEYAKYQQRFLLFEIANANENAHSKFLERILTYNNYQFLSSFLREVLSYEKELNSPCISTQKSSIGNKNGKSKGFIDVYIENGKDKIIIENKIKRAGDTTKQLARYVATALDIASENFDNWYKEYENNGHKCECKELSNIYVVYLTRLNSDKGPNIHSLPVALKESLGENHFQHVSYEDYILPWLKEYVLPLIPYEKDGLIICALRQYIAYLEYLLEAQDWQKGWTSKQSIAIFGETPIKQYEGIGEEIKRRIEQTTSNNIDECASQYITTLDFFREELFCHDLETTYYVDWRIHYTPSFILLYKQSWVEADDRKYSCPTLQIIIHTPFHKCGSRTKNIKVSFAVTHISPTYFTSKNKDDAKTFADRIVSAIFMENDESLRVKDKWDDHNRLYRILNNKSFKLNLDDFNKQEVRKNFYESIINNNDFVAQINRIDDIVQKFKLADSSI